MTNATTEFWHLHGEDTPICRARLIRHIPRRLYREAALAEAARLRARVQQQCGEGELVAFTEAGEEIHRETLWTTEKSRRQTRDGSGSRRRKASVRS